MVPLLTLMFKKACCIRTTCISCNPLVRMSHEQFIINSTASPASPPNIVANHTDSLRKYVAKPQILAYTVYHPPNGLTLPWVTAWAGRDLPIQAAAAEATATAATLAWQELIQAISQFISAIIFLVMFYAIVLECIRCIHIYIYYIIQTYIWICIYMYIIPSRWPKVTQGHWACWNHKVLRHRMPCGLRRGHLQRPLQKDDGDR